MKFSSSAENKNKISSFKNYNQNKGKIKGVTDPLFGAAGEMLTDDRKNPECPDPVFK